MQICTRGNQQLDDFLVASFSRTMQRSRSTLTLRIHINPFFQFRLNARKIAILRSIVNRISEGSFHQQQGSDYCEQEVFHFEVITIALSVIFKTVYLSFHQFLNQDSLEYQICPAALIDNTDVHVVDPAQAWVALATTLIE